MLPVVTACSIATRRHQAPGTPPPPPPLRPTAAPHLTVLLAALARPSLARRGSACALAPLSLRGRGLGGAAPYASRTVTARISGARRSNTGAISRVAT